MQHATCNNSHAAYDVAYNIQRRRGARSAHARFRRSLSARVRSGRTANGSGRLDCESDRPMPSRHRSRAGLAGTAVPAFPRRAVIMAHLAQLYVVRTRQRLRTPHEMNAEHTLPHECYDAAGRPDGPVSTRSTIGPEGRRQPGCLDVSVDEEAVLALDRVQQLLHVVSHAARYPTSTGMVCVACALPNSCM
jgi:hypothetical protein